MDTDATKTTPTNPTPRLGSSGGSAGTVTMATRGGGDDRGGGGGGRGGGMGYEDRMGHAPTEGGPSSGFSNRNSHPFTEREVEQSFQQMEGKSCDYT